MKQMMLAAAFATLIASAASAQAQTPLNEHLEKTLPPEGVTAFYDALQTEGVSHEDVTGIEVIPGNSADGTPELVVTGDPAKHKKDLLVFVGAQVGSFYPVALESIVAFRKNQKPWIDLNARIEPSSMIQSYSVGAAYHPGGHAFYTGVQFRDYRLTQASNPYYDPQFDRYFALSGEVGLRNNLFKSPRWLGVVSVGVTYIPSERISLPVTYNLNVGVAYRVFRRK